MNKRKILLFSILTVFVALFFTVTAFAANEKVYFKAKGENGRIIERETEVGELFNVTSTGGNRTIDGIASDVLGFKRDQIFEISIPAGIKKVSITEACPSIKKIVFDDVSLTGGVKITGLTGLETIEAKGDMATLTFSVDCINTSAPLKEIIIKSSTAKITFDSKCFADVTTLKSVVFAAGDKDDSCTYTFKSNCFKNTGIERLELIDNAKFELNDATGSTGGYENIFANCSNLKYVYLGNTIKMVAPNMFANCNALETVYVCAAETFKSGAFKITEGKESCKLNVLVHTQKVATVDEGIFAGRKTEGVVMCVLSTRITKLNDCIFELHVGVQHCYYAVEDGSCYITYATDCSCGKVSNAYYKMYVGSGSRVEKTHEIKIIPTINPSGSHSYTEAERAEYVNGIDKEGLVVLKCAVCGESDGVERVADPLVTFLGYSVSEFGDTKAVTAGVKYDYLAIERYEQIVGNEFEFGMVLAASAVLDGKNPLNSDGTAISNKVLVVNMSGADDYEANITMSGLSGRLLDTELVISAYVIVGNEVKYYQGNGATKSPDTVTYSQLIK